MSQIDVLRRSAQRGLRAAQSAIPSDGVYIDIFQHILDEIERLEKSMTLSS